MTPGKQLQADSGTARAPLPASLFSLPSSAVFVVTALVAASIRYLYLREFWDTFPFYRDTVEGFDAHVYNTWGQSLAKGDWRSQSIGAFYYAPMYPYLLGVLYKIAGVGNIVAAFTMNVAIGVFGAVCAAGLARLLFNNLAGLIAGLAFALCGPEIVAEGFLLNDAFAATMGLAGTWLSLAWWRRETEGAHRNGWTRWGGWAGAGLFFSAMILARGSNLLPIAFFGLWLLAVCWLRKEGGWRRLLPAVVVGVAIWTPLLAVFLRNGIVWKNWAITTNGGVIFYIGNAPGSTGTFGYPPQFEDRKAEINKLPEWERSKAWRTQLWKELDAAPGHFRAMLALKTKLFFNAWDAPDNYNYHFLRRHIGALQWTLGSMPLHVLGLVGIALTASRWRALLPLYLLMVGIAISLIVMFVIGRYKLPYLGLLCVFAGGGLALLPELLRGRRFGPLAAAALVALAAIPLHKWNPSPKEAYAELLRPNEYLFNVRGLLEAERFADAEALAKDGMALWPTLPQLREPIMRHLYQNERWPELLERTKAAIDANAAGLFTLEAHAIALARNGQEAHAVAFAKQVLRHAPNSRTLQQIAGQR